MSSASSSGASSRSERIAWRARRSPTKRGSRRFAAPGMIPSLRAGSVQRVPASIRLWSTVSSSWQPPPIANVSAAAIHSFSIVSSGARSRVGEAAQHLVHQPEVAHREEQVGDLAAVEVREVQPGAEDPPAGVARVLDDAAAQHRDLDLLVEQREVDRGLQRAGRGVVLGVEVARVAQLDRADLAVADDRRGAEIDVAGALQLLDGARARARSGAASRRSGGGRPRGRRGRGRAACPGRSRARPCPSAGARARASTTSRRGVRPGTRSAAA